VPMLVLESPILAVDGLPPIDLSSEMRAAGAPLDDGARRLSGVAVQRSQAPRHGTANAARHVQRGVALSDYLTPRLWGVADSAPYLHDGARRASTTRSPGTTARAPRRAPRSARCRSRSAGPLRVYLMSLRRARALVVPERPRVRVATQVEDADADLPSTGWRSEPISKRGRPCPSGSGARRMCHPNQQSASSPTSSAQDRARPAGAQLDAPDAIGAVAAMPRRADGESLRCRRRRDRPPRRSCAVELARLRPVQCRSSCRGAASRRAARPSGSASGLRARRGDGELALAVAVEVRDARRRRRRSRRARRSRPVPSSVPSPSREIQAAPDHLAGGVLRGRAPTARSARRSAVESSSARRTSRRWSGRRRRVGAERPAVLPLTRWTRPGRRARRRRGRCVRPRSGRRRSGHVPSEVLVRALRVPPELSARLRASARRRCPASAVAGRLRRRDDDVGEPVAGEVGHRHHPVPK
jgi:hypothetical protein